MKTLLIPGAAMLLCTASPLIGQQPPDQGAAMPSISAAQRQFEAGQYRPALAAIDEARKTGAAGTAETFLAAQAWLRLNDPQHAKDEFTRMAASDDPAVKLAAQSASALIDNQLDRAVTLATQAVGAVTARTSTEAGSTAPAPDSPAVAYRHDDFYAFYQLGLVRTRQEDWTGAADAFARAGQIDPMFAYAHYYAGSAYSRLKRPDQVAVQFEQFLKLAPNAPERSAVMSIMRTLRGA
jgi:tetratricopeptide (TPR) repeat protein